MYSGQAILSWEAPTTNEDGTSLTDLAGYKIYYGTTTGNYTQNIDVGNVTTYTFSNLTNGSTYIFVATAYNTARIESSYSNEVSKSIPSAQSNTLTVNRAGSGTGTVTSSPAGISCGADCSEAYNAGTVVTLTATADGSSTFGGWSGACTGTGSCTVTMDAAKTVTATFTLKTYTITATAGSGGSITPSGTVTVN
ncbi:MAG: fibronectin type III domain-containing protein, partial [Thermodesulfovibrionales bacterium]